MELIISIDPGKINIGISIGKFIPNKPLLIDAVDHVAYKSDEYFTSYIQAILDIYRAKTVRQTIVIERQPYNSQISGNMRYIQGYFTGKGIRVILVQPTTHGMHIPSYKQRKDYSLQLAYQRLKQTNIQGTIIVLDKLDRDIRKHDIADSFNQLYTEWERIYYKFVKSKHYNNDTNNNQSHDLSQV